MNESREVYRCRCCRCVGAIHPSCPSRPSYPQGQEPPAALQCPHCESMDFEHIRTEHHTPGKPFTAYFPGAAGAAPAAPAAPAAEHQHAS